MRRLALLLLFAVLAACDSGGGNAAPGSLQQNAELRTVVDGDTITVHIDGRTERVRLIGIDTPETKKPDTPVECFGPEASAFTTKLLPVGTPLHLQRDVEARDKYGRLLAYVYRVKDGMFVNLEIIAKGYARLLTIPPNVTHVDRFVTAARDAQRQNLGLWSGCAG